MSADEADVFDVAVIGAGINGAGIARDAALRGLRVVVFDKGDVSNATTAICSRLVHGGLRYLEYGELPLVYESLHERRNLRKIAPHLVTPLRVTIPIYSGASRSRLIIRLGLLLYDLLSWNKSLPGHDMLSRQALLQEEAGVLQESLLGAARYSDAQVTYAERLVVENIVAAAAAGATVNTYCEVVALDVDDRVVSRLRWRDKNGKLHESRAAAVVNAAGPWVDELLQRSPVSVDRLIGGTKGSHIVVDRFDGAPQDAFYVEAASDARPFFIIPWNGQYLIGTTDIRYDGGLDRIRASDAEVDYLLAETNRVFPAAKLSRNDINFAYAGVRPLPYRQAGPESAITRRHIIRRNRRVANNLLSIIGGKLTTYRNLAEQCVDKLQKLLRRRLPACRTREVLLPGAHGLEEARLALDEKTNLSQAGVQRLLAIYGGRAAEIAALTEEDDSLLSDGLLAAEVRFVLRHEFARTLIDIVFRRTMLGLNADQGRNDYESIAAVAADEREWNATQTQVELQALHEYADSLLVA